MKNQVLTDRTVATLRPPATGRVEVWDAALPGFGFRCTSRGVKSWQLFYRVGGRQRRETLGRYPGMSLAEARKTARDRLQKASEGVDPLADRPRKPSGPMTFGSLAERYIKREVPRLKRGAETESLIRRELLPAWEHLPLAEIRKGDARDIIETIVDAGKPYAAFRAYETIQRLFRWAFEYFDDRELGIEVSPVSTLKPPIEKQERTRTLSRSEITAIWQGCDAVGYPFGPLVKLLLLTGQRRGEVSDMTRDEIDFDDRIWTLPPERTKNGRGHVVPLSMQAMDILRGLPRLSGPHVFSTTGGVRPVSGHSKMKSRLDTFAGVEGWRLHDLRRACRTGLSELGIAESVSERVLNHTPEKLIRTYDRHRYVSEMRGALEAWGRHVDAIVRGETAGTVVEMRPGR